MTRRGAYHRAAVTESRDERREQASIDERGIRPPGPFAIVDRASAPGVSLVALQGELDLVAAPRLRTRIEQVAGGDALVLDLSEATFIDSAVLKELLRARAELAERDSRLVLAGVPPPIRRLLDVTGTSELFQDAPDAETAIRRLTA
jgi:anti-sigma B factor antagonist